MFRSLLLALVLASAYASNECNPLKMCNVCTACCKAYIDDGKECNNCVKTECTGPAPVPPTPSPPTPSPPTPAPGHEPNPPNWPSTVNVFTPGQSDTQSVINAAFATNGGHLPANHGAFSDERYAFLFMPGTYTVDVPVGFYTTVHGLGEAPSGVVFSGPKGVYSEEGDYDMKIGALNSFWRSAENFKSTANNAWFAGPEGKGLLWACSQASPLRRIEVATDLLLFQYTSGRFAGFASGGFMANVKVAGAVNSGSQQQYLIRNCELGAGGWTNGVWDMVFVGTDNAPASHCGSAFPVPPVPKPYVTVPTTPVVAEKPFITADPQNAGKFNLQIPGVRQDSTGVEHTLAGATTVGFEHVYVTSPTDTAEAINKKLAAGLHVVVSPGIYQLTQPLLLAKDNQVLLGLGMATLISAAGTPVVQVATNVDGVRVAGLLLQAGPKPTPALLRWGDPHTGKPPYRGKASNPGVISDVFARVGGPDTSPVQAKVMVQILSGNVIGDDLWLWRADHNTAGIVSGGANPCDNAIQVRGDDVTMYGLAVEHTLADLVLWTGENGRTYFLQSEYPYDVTQEYGDAGYAAYKVAANVTKHAGYGVGVYHFFRDHPVTVQTGISVPPALEGSFTAPLGVYLNGLGTMSHIINDKGVATSSTSPYAAAGAHSAWYCGPPPPTPAPTPIPARNQTILSIDAGGVATADHFVADAYFSGGTAYTGSGIVNISGVADWKVAPQAVYSTVRWGEISYALPGLEDGVAYKVRLHWAEMTYNGPGRRAFNVAINGKPVETNLDIVAVTGAGHKALMKEYDALSTGGKITVDFTNGKTDNAMISGLEVLSSVAPPSPPSAFLAFV
jgi:hypothetical protein